MDLRICRTINYYIEPMLEWQQEKWSYKFEIDSKKKCHSSI